MKGGIFPRDFLVDSQENQRLTYLKMRHRMGLVLNNLLEKLQFGFNCESLFSSL